MGEITHRDLTWAGCQHLVGYDITEIEDMIAGWGPNPIFTRKKKPEAPAGEADASEFISQSTHVDVAAELAGIHYGAIHDTWKRCMASLLACNEPVAAAIETIFAATNASPGCQADPGKPKWMHGLCEMAVWFLRQDPLHVLQLPAEVQVAWHQKIDVEGKRPLLVYDKRTGLQLRGWGGRQDPSTSAQEKAASLDPDNVAHAPGRKPAATIFARPFERFDPAKLPPREWLYDKHYQRGIVTATVGPGGGGKSSLDLVELIAMCTGRDLLGVQRLIRCRAWYHNAEDSRDEIYRRIAAVCQHYKIDQGELDGWLFVTSGIDMPVRLAASRHGGQVTINAATAEAITRTIGDNEIGVASFDPLVAHHNAVENATGDMDGILREFARIANVTDCALEIVHHTRKPAPGQEELNVADSRGAGAIINAVRSARVLNPMSKAEAAKVGIDEVYRRLYFRVDTGKANMAPPAAARWHQFTGVDLPNGDNVGVVLPWTYPSEGTSDLPDTACAAVQAEVAKGEFLSGARSPNWVGHLVTRIFRLDPAAKVGNAVVGRHLAALYTKGVITTAKKGKVNIVVPGPWKAP
jgi:hypothetical protein